MEKAYKLEFGGQPGGELFMTCCGCSRTEPLHCFGPAMKPHYLIHYVLNGRGIFKMEGEEYPLEAGCGFLIEPGQMSFYQADEKDPWMYIWVGFAGERAEEYVKSMGISPRHPVFHSEQSDELYSIVRDMMDHNTVCCIFFCRLWRRVCRRKGGRKRIGRTSMSAGQWNLFSVTTATRSG